MSWDQTQHDEHESTYYCKACDGEGCKACEYTGWEGGREP